MFSPCSSHIVECHPCPTLPLAQYSWEARIFPLEQEFFWAYHPHNISVFLVQYIQFKWLNLCTVTQSCLTLCHPMDYSTPSLPVHHQLPELAQTHVHWVGDAIQPSHLLSSPSPPAFNLSQHQGLFQWVSSLHQVAKVLELQFQHQCTLNEQRKHQNRGNHSRM